MIVVYALKSDKDGRIYVGMTVDIKRRFNEHNRGRVKSTKGYRPWILIYRKNVVDRLIARNLEKKLKSGAGKEFLKDLLNSRL